MLCQETNSSHQTVTTHLKKLKEKGFLFIEELSHKKRVYSLSEELFSEYETGLLSQGVAPSEAKLRRFEGGKIPEVLAYIKGVSSSQKILILWLASKCRDSKFLIPYLHRQEEMTLELGLSRNSLTRAIRALETKGLLHVIRTIKHPNVYSLDEVLFSSSPQQEVENFNEESNNGSKNGDPGHKKLRDNSKRSLNDSSFEGHELSSCCCCCKRSLPSSQTIEGSLPMSQDSSAQLQTSFPSPATQMGLSLGNPTALYSLYAHMDYLPIPEEWKKPENESFGIAKLLLVLGKEDSSICSFTVHELSKSLLEMFGLSVLRETKKLCFKYGYFGMSFHKLYWVCQEISERRNPFQAPRNEEEQKNFLAQKKQNEEKTARVEAEVHKKYLADQYEQKKREVKKEESLKEGSSFSLEPEVSTENPLETFKRKLLTIFLKFYQGPEDQLMNFLNSISLVNLRAFRNEYERLPRERFEGYMKTLMRNQFGGYLRNNS